jgi:8-oxo-dGTP pyrophosphatase MutT (NUDIX family)
VKPPRVTSSEVVYENRWLRLREDRLEREDGTPGLYSVVEKRPAAVVLPVHEDGSVTLVEQYRHPVGQRFWELPQGALDGEDDAGAEHIGRTELAEETGLRAGSMRRLGRLYFAYGISDQYFDAWLATDLVQGDQALEAEEEGLRVHRFAPGHVDEMIRAGTIADAATVAVFHLHRRSENG